MEIYKQIATAFVVILLVFGISIVGWYLGRDINYRFAYRSLVKETIREMVKQEALKP